MFFEWLAISFCHFMLHHMPTSTFPHSAFGYGNSYSKSSYGPQTSHSEHVLKRTRPFGISDEVRKMHFNLFILVFLILVWKCVYHNMHISLFYFSSFICLFKFSIFYIHVFVNIGGSLWRLKLMGQAHLLTFNYSSFTYSFSSRLITYR